MDSKVSLANTFADMIIHDKKTAHEVAKEFGVSKTKVLTYVHKYATGLTRRIRLKKQLKANQKKWFKK